MSRLWSWATGKPAGAAAAASAAQKRVELATQMARVEQERDRVDEDYNRLGARLQDTAPAKRKQADLDEWKALKNSRDNLDVQLKALRNTKANLDRVVTHVQTAEVLRAGVDVAHTVATRHVKDNMDDVVEMTRELDRTMSEAQNAFSSIASPAGPSRGLDLYDLDDIEFEREPRLDLDERHAEPDDRERAAVRTAVRERPFEA
jgi:hypothetical protein